MPSQTDIRQSITSQIISALESGKVPPWRRPWRLGKNAGGAANVVSKTELPGPQSRSSWTSPARSTASRRSGGERSPNGRALGGRVMPRPSQIPPGKWGTQIVFWAPVNKKVQNDQGDLEDDRFFVLRLYTVFNIDQVEGKNWITCGLVSLTPVKPSSRLPARRGRHRGDRCEHQVRRWQGVLQPIRRLHPDSAKGNLRVFGRVLWHVLP